ncbi:outer membrane protein, TIGR04327 family [Leptospira inadai serovar Lyme str. 10]|uniref:Outer membrane protein, TIGR04327 family n=2 Tax=Leptospira inadai serovar Lyme TaxID=293084 RepID=V6H842_9LEPT|nr:LA_2444/LA_4059 family outer membrane protein [Leptospira inadai]EQA34991.1 outer membrane protein, TIGR04327 family [Leptospira inadai serovar Lyme str. 10]PNV72581.1 hypothetical protein BES34_019060 [Leptospira inadai serovar Lyme]
MKPILRTILVFLIVLQVIIFTPLYAQGANDKIPDPDALEREADDLEYQAGRSQNPVERRKLAQLAVDKRKQAVDARNAIQDRELTKPFDAATFELQTVAMQSTWESESLARNKNIGSNTTSALLNYSGIYQTALNAANGLGANPNLLNNNMTLYSSPQGNTRTAYPIRLSYLSKNRNFGIEVNYLDVRMKPSYTTFDAVHSTSNLPAIQFHSVEHKRQDYSLNLAWYFPTGTGARIGPSIGVRNVDIYSKEYGNIPGNYGFGSMSEKATGLGPQAGFRIFKNLLTNVLVHARFDYFRTLGHYDRNSQGTIVGIGGNPYLLTTGPTGNVKDNLLSRTGYEIDAGISLLRTRWLKFTVGFQFTEMTSRVSGYNYNASVFPGAPGDGLFLNQVSKTLDQASSIQALQKDVHDKFYGFYFGASLLL